MRELGQNQQVSVHLLYLSVSFEASSLCAGRGDDGSMRHRSIVGRGKTLLSCCPGHLRIHLGISLNLDQGIQILM